jgi:hypothetical protein
VAGPQFYGRDRLAQAIAGRQYGDLVIMGGRQSGKTSLLRRVEELCTVQDAPCLFLDFQTSGRTPDGLNDLMQAEVRRKASCWPYLLSPDLCAVPDLFTLVYELSRRAEMLDVRLLLLLDELVVLLEMMREHSELLAWIRDMIGGFPGLQVVAAASRSLLDASELRAWRLTSPEARLPRLRCLTSLNKRAAGALIEQHNSVTPVRVDPALAGQIAEITGRQPYLLQRLCQRLYQADHSLRAPSESDIAVDELLGSLYRADYESLLGEQKALLWLVADNAGADVLALQTMTGLDATSVGSNLYWLGCLGWVRRCRRGYFVGNAFLSLWLSSNRESLVHLDD